MAEEAWQAVTKFPHYSISSFGRVKNNKTGEVRRITITDPGFPAVTLYGADSKSRYLRHINVMVAEAFLPTAIDDKMTAVWHIDGDPQNCRADNLRWEYRNRVLDWNEQHRLKAPRLRTPRVRNNRTGIVYENAYECAMAEGDLESTIVWKAEKGSPRYSYVTEKDL